uniref:Phosphoenolpyruvate carboxylase n=1 Tax=Rhizophora mucronata TaxID=61149 RepID=A0A2P2JT32_RHIMU
MHNSGFWCLEK